MAVPITLEHVIGGTLGGIVATVLGLLFGGAWRGTIVPWYEERVYKDAKIEGTWKGKATDGAEVTQDILTLKRQGHRVSGTIQVAGARGGYYEFEGTFKNLIVSAIYSASDPVYLNRGSFTLRLEDNGHRLEGKCVHYDDQNNTIATQDYVLERS